MNKKKIFIASSSESLDIANAVNINLDREYEITPWSNGAFSLSSTTIQDLVRMSSSVDFAIFIFAPDDVSIIRNREEHTVRDNVIFELGLFIGAIGVERCFIVKPRNVEFKLPSDLLGITLADYESFRSDGNLQAALGAPCSLMRNAMQSLGGLNRRSVLHGEKLKVNPAKFEINEKAIKVLGCCLSSMTSTPEGLGLQKIAYDTKLDSKSVSLQLIKLEKMSLVEKEIVTSNYNGEDYYSYSITEEGVNILLDNEELYDNGLSEDF